MKKIFALSIAVLAISACSKSPGGAPTFIGEETAPSGEPSLVNDRLATEAGLKKLVYHVGPVDIPDGLKAEDMAEKPLVMNFQTDEAVWAVGFQPKMVDSKGTELPSELLHTAIVKNLHEDNPFCSDAGSGNPFVAATSVLTEVELPQGYGYPILSSDPIEAQVVLKNKTGSNFVDAFFELTLLVKPMGEFAELKDVRPMLVELDPCGHKGAEVPPGEFVDFSASYEIPSEGSVVVANGLIGDFASSVELLSGEKGTPFWSAEAKLDKDHKATELSGNPFSDPEGVQFKEGDTISLKVSYDNTSDSWVTGGAAAMIYFAPKE